MVRFCRSFGHDSSTQLRHTSLQELSLRETLVLRLSRVAGKEFSESRILEGSAVREAQRVQGHRVQGKTGSLSSTVRKEVYTPPL